MKKTRLFVRGDEATDNVAWLCGGPDPKEAAEGLKNHLECVIELAMSGSAGYGSMEIELFTKEMTDEEVNALGEVYAIVATPQ